MTDELPELPARHVLDPVDGLALFLAARFRQAPPRDVGPFTDAPLFPTLNAVTFDGKG